ncbi:hypothetical protein [Schlesneria paludicola]|uniref:hypothetical protein n=1 Tax=Schlesneria paludicola TaxID=360056 RepID=UPI00029B0EE0|nr:hypothetical protein [Schlesneria paludicola]
MKTLVAALFTALVVFALATAWMEVVQPRMELMARATAAKSDQTETKSSKRRSSRKSAARARSDEGDSDDESFDDEGRGNVSSKSSRGRSSRESDEKAEQRLLTQLEKVKQQEAKLVERQSALELIYRDIYRELAEVEEIRRRSASELALAEQKISAVATNSVPDTASIAVRTNESNRTAATPKPRVAAETRIAGVIHDLAKQGKVSAAASLLSGMKDRDVAKVLMSLSARDPGLALQLSDQVQAAKQSTIRR